jgi:hypothetical protein
MIPLLFQLSLPPSIVPPDVVQQAATLRDLALSRTGAIEIVQSLTDGVGPRLSGSEGAQAARAWALSTLASLGFQNVHAEAVVEPRWERGVEEAEILSPRQRLVVTALGGSPPTPPGGLQGKVVGVADLESLRVLLAGDPAAVRGRIVFFTERMERTRDGSGYGRAVAMRSQGAKAVSAAGGLAVLIRSVGTSSSRLPHTGAMQTDGPVVPAAAVSAPDADLLERLLPRGISVRLSLGCRVRPDAPSANIVGELKGTGEEVVLLGAHLDSWDLGQGALDDGAGVGIILDAARILRSSSHPLRRTVRVVLFANEENGSRGGQGYALAHAAEAPVHASALEMDLGADPVYGFASLTGPEGRAATDAIFELLKPLGVTERAEGGESGADVSPLIPLGVPMLSLRQDASRYFDFHHSADDTLDKIDPRNMQQAVAAVVAVTAVVADMPGTLGRVPPQKPRSE